MLLSHPRDFTPVCTDELSYLAKIKPELDMRDVKIVGLWIDPVDNHAQVGQRHRRTQGHPPNYPVIGDADFAVLKLYGMLPADTVGDPTQRTRHRTRPSATSHRPGQEDQTCPRLPDDDWPQLRRGAAGHRLTPTHCPPSSRHTRQYCRVTTSSLPDRCPMTRRGPSAHKAATRARPYLRIVAISPSPTVSHARMPPTTLTASTPARAGIRHRRRPAPERQMTRIRLSRADRAAASPAAAFWWTGNPASAQAW